MRARMWSSARGSLLSPWRLHYQPARPYRIMPTRWSDEDTTSYLFKTTVRMLRPASSRLPIRRASTLKCAGTAGGNTGRNPQRAARGLIAIRVTPGTRMVSYLIGSDRRAVH